MGTKRILLIVVGVLLVGALIAIFLWRSGLAGVSDRPREAFSAARPFALEVRRERSYFQARRIMRRLRGMGEDAYVLPFHAADGDWYRVVCGAFASDSLARAYRDLLAARHHLTCDTLVDFRALDSAARIPLEAVAVEEVERIEALPPDVPDTLMHLFQKYPSNDLFYLRSISLTRLDAASLAYSGDYKYDLPRGVQFDWLREQGVGYFSSVIYEDNLYASTVTLQIMNLRSTPNPQRASVFPEMMTDLNRQAVEICSAMAERILGTGEYADEERVPLPPIQAWSTLSGYRVSFQHAGEQRNYLLLTDEEGLYLYTLQYTSGHHAEMLTFLEGLGRAKGLEEYNEFYNTFYTIADRQLEDDFFCAYSLSKLNGSYAQQRGYAPWAVRMVGLWHASMIFGNASKGPWKAGIFDLLNEENASEIYNELYQNRLEKSEQRTIYGRPGAAIHGIVPWIGMQLEEVNSSIGRYVVAVNPFLYRYEEQELVDRLERLQLMCGGYAAHASTEQ